MNPRERKMLIFLGVVAVGALAFFLLTSGDGEPEETTAPTSISSSPGSATSPLPVEEEGQEQEEQEEQEGPEEALDFLGGRDPFVPLVEEAATGGETSTGDTTTGETTTGTDDTTTGDTTTGGESTTGETTTGETGGTTPGETTTGDSSSGGTGSGGGSSGGGGADVAFTGRPVTLVSTSSRGSGDVARVNVDGETFTVTEGQRFSRHYRLVSVGRYCAQVLFGDRTFILCEE